jgi:hypothetical protein
MNSPKMFLVWCGTGTKRSIEATGPREAAEQWAADDDREHDLAIARAEGGGLCLYVRPADEPGAVPRLWRVIGELVPSYRARAEK